MPIYINKPKTNKKSWNGWGRTNAYSYQKQMPYHLATFHNKFLFFLFFNKRIKN